MTRAGLSKGGRVPLRRTDAALRPRRRKSYRKRLTGAERMPVPCVAMSGKTSPDLWWGAIFSAKSWDTLSSGQRKAKPFAQSVATCLAASGKSIRLTILPCNCSSTKSNDSSITGSPRNGTTRITPANALRSIMPRTSLAPCFWSMPSEALRSNCNRAPFGHDEDSITSGAHRWSKRKPQHPRGAFFRMESNSRRWVSRDANWGG